MGLEDPGRGLGRVSFVAEILLGPIVPDVVFVDGVDVGLLVGVIVLPFDERNLKLFEL